MSLWFTRACTHLGGSGNHYEYLYSHHHTADPNTAWSTSYVDMYIACESMGGGYSSADGTVQRSFLRDAAGTEAHFDFELHDAGQYDVITSSWVHTVLVVTLASRLTSMRITSEWPVVGEENG